MAVVDQSARPLWVARCTGTDALQAPSVPATSQQSQASSHHSAITCQQPPASNHKPPLANEQSQDSSHHSAITCQQSQASNLKPAITSQQPPPANEQSQASSTTRCRWPCLVDFEEDDEPEHESHARRNSSSECSCTSCSLFGIASGGATEGKINPVAAKKKEPATKEPEVPL